MRSKRKGKAILKLLLFIIIIFEIVVEVEGMFTFRKAKEKKVDFVGTKKEDRKNVVEKETKNKHVVEEHENYGIEESQVDDGARLSNYGFPEHLK
ncbi:unnamed protein product [Meloidogyne enterolobii]|uniref:Uncharacterized protein n=1 Tax=Meloidogyne enterolobii TaxID=390850 RepID=A0ACB1AGC7_MELEN